MRQEAVSIEQLQASLEEELQHLRDIEKHK